MDKFELTEKQQKDIKEWKEHIKAIFGEYGNYEYIFAPCEIGVGLKVHSTIANVTKEFTDFNSW